MKKSKIIASAGVVGALIVIITVAIINVRPYLNVGQVAQNAIGYDGKEIEVIGTVQSFNNGTSFTLADGANSISVMANSTTIPTGFQNSIRVVVMGVFHSSSMSMEAIQILTQCSN